MDLHHHFETFRSRWLSGVTLFSFPSDSVLHGPCKLHAGYELQLYNFFIVPVSAGKGSSAKTAP